MELKGFSQVKYLVSLPALKISEVLNHLTDEQANVLLHDWAFWARPEQFPPKEWGKDGFFIWYFRAGRGVGKTQACAELLSGLSDIEIISILNWQAQQLRM